MDDIVKSYEYVNGAEAKFIWSAIIPRGDENGKALLVNAMVAMAFSTTGLLNTHVIFVFRHGKHLM